MNANNQTLTGNTRFHGGANAVFHGPVAFDNIVRATTRWMARSSQRRHLSTLSTRQLEDVGISANAAAAEAAKPFWRA